MFKAVITIRRRPSILDPEGKAIQHALSLLEYSQFNAVRTGKLIEMTIEGDDEERARDSVRQACERLLANPVMEDFTFTIERADASQGKP